MKKNYKLILSAFTALSAFTFADNADARSLEDALGVAYKTNPELQAERERIKAIDENLPAAYSGYLPTFKAIYERSRENEKLGTNPEESNTPNTKSLTLDQNLFAGGKTYYSIKQANSLIKSGRESLRGVEQQVLLNAVTAYIDVVKAREVLKLSENNEKVLQEQLQATNDRFKLGEATKTDVAQAESRLARAQSEKINASGGLVAAESLYAKIFGEQPAIDMEVPAKDLNLPEKFEDALELAKTKNPGLKKTQFDSESAENQIGVSRSTILPNVSVRGDITRTEGDGATLSVTEREDERITLNVTVPIFQSGAEYATIRNAKRKADSAKYSLKDTENSVIDSVTKAWQDIQTTRSNIKATSASLKAAEIALEGVKQEQKVGSRTVLDILDAEQERFSAEVALVTARRNEVVAAYSLKAAIGELSAADLGLNVELYDPDVYLDDVKYQFVGY